MEFLVEFELNVPEGAPESEVRRRDDAEASAAARLADEGNLALAWKQPVAGGEIRTGGLYRADSEARLDAGPPGGRAVRAAIVMTRSRLWRWT